MDWQTLKENRGFLIVTLIVLLIYVGGPMVDRIQGQIQLVEERGIMALGTTRVFVWFTSLKMIGNAPWFGHGIGVEPLTQATYSFVPQEYWDLVVIKRGNYIIPHNSYLTVAAQIGIPGAILFALLQLWILGLIVKIKVQNVLIDLEHKYLINTFFVILVGSYIQSLAISAQLDKMIWLMMGMSVALCIFVDGVVKPVYNTTKNIAK